MKKSLTGWDCSIVIGILALMGGHAIVDAFGVFGFLLGSIALGWIFYWLWMLVTGKSKAKLTWVYIDVLGREKTVKEPELIGLIRSKALPEKTQFKTLHSDEWQCLAYSDELTRSLDDIAPEDPPEKKLLKWTAAIIFLMVLFPPYEQIINSRVVWSGYGLIYNLPNKVFTSTGDVQLVASTVNVNLLALQIFATLAISLLVYFSIKK